MKRILLIVAAFLALTACTSQSNKSAEELKTAENLENTPIGNGKQVGAFTDQRSLEDAEAQLFDQMTSGLVGVKVTPISVATQVVSGTNYKFICKSVSITHEPVTDTIAIWVFQPLPGQGEPRITQLMAQ